MNAQLTNRVEWVVIIDYPVLLQESMTIQLTNQLQLEGEEKRKLHNIIQEEERYSRFDFLVTNDIKE